MKNYFHKYLFILLYVLSSCSKPTDEAIKLVELFFNENYINDKIYGEHDESIKKSLKNVDFSYLSPEMEKLVRNHYLSLPDIGTYKLSAEKKSKTSVIVTSIGKTNGFIGNVNLRHQFLISKINGEWRIADSYNLISFSILVKSDDWNTLWDVEKSIIHSEVIENLKLEIITHGYNSVQDFRHGKLRIVNNSNYEIDNLMIQIEHFDINEISVRNNKTYVSDVIRKNSYREVEWISDDCNKCYREKFTIGKGF